MQDQFFTLDQFKAAYGAGAFVKVKLVSNWVNFNIEVEMRGGSSGRLVTSRPRSGLRQFLNPAAALALLRKLGVSRVEVHLDAWDLSLASLSMRMRPDVTARRLRQKRIAEAAYYPNAPRETGELSRSDEFMRLINKKGKDAAKGFGH